MKNDLCTTEMIQFCIVCKSVQVMPPSTVYCCWHVFLDMNSWLSIFLWRRERQQIECSVGGEVTALQRTRKSQRRESLCCVLNNFMKLPNPLDRNCSQPPLLCNTKSWAMETVFLCSCPDPSQSSVYRCLFNLNKNVEGCEQTTLDSPRLTFYWPSIIKSHTLYFGRFVPGEPALEAAPEPKIPEAPTRSVAVPDVAAIKVKIITCRICHKNAYANVF